MIAKQLKVGMIVEYQKGLYRVLHTQIIAPGNWRAFVQAKLRNIVSGTQTETRFRTDEDLQRAVLDRKDVEFLYADGESYHVMDTQSYEQFHLTAELLGDAVRFLKPNMRFAVDSYEGRPVGVELPQTVTLKVVETDPFMKSATVTNSYKTAKLETGASIQVPGFISEGEMVEIDTATGEYLGKAK
ncbi:MAG TPA: elongation factor P [Bdellovibrionota bacterium]|nr:elongation factor P [Bdellovibrionota bacterium]